MNPVVKILFAVLTLMLCCMSAISAEPTAPVAETMSLLAIQIGIILFAVRAGGALAKKLRMPSVLGELLSGVVIGPYALGAITLPGVPDGLFPVGTGTLAVSPELYGFATVASIILLFTSGLETDIGLFLRYSLRGGIIGLGGVIASFGLGALTGMLVLGTGFMDPRCLFLGILSTATSVGITARILSERKKMDSPEGVTILAAAVFDDVLGIIMLAVVLGIVSLLNSSDGTEKLSLGRVGLIAERAFAIWLGFTALGLIFSRQIARFLKLFKNSFDFSVLALGVALILSGVFEMEGLAMIIGAYIAGLSLARTDIAAVIQERLHGLYQFFVPLFFAVMGMLVNVKELLSLEVLFFGLIYTAIAVVSKVLGCALPALSLGFNLKGAMRIGTGMVPRGEVALIIAGIGLAAGILDNQLFGVIIMMTLLTTVLAPPALNAVLAIPGRGTRKESKGSDTVNISWEFPSDEIALLVTDSLLADLKSDGFYVQMMNMDEGLSQARKGDIALSITEENSRIRVETAPEDLAFVKTSIYEVVVKLHDAIERLKESIDPVALKQDVADSNSRKNRRLLDCLDPQTVIMHLNAVDKKAIIEELVDALDNSGKLLDRNLVLEDVLAREHTMSTGMQKGIALPHGKSDGIGNTAVAIGFRPEGAEFGSLDGEPSRIFVLIVSPRKVSGPHLQILASLGSLLRSPRITERLLAAGTAEDVVALLRQA